MKTIEMLHGHLFCGLGGGKEGLNEATAEVDGFKAVGRCIGGIDVDPKAIEKFNKIGPGRPGTVIDLMSLEQYIAFHDKRPPPGWREAIAADIHTAFGNERPDVGFLSAPCKGFSGLLSELKSLSAKYQALNHLTLRGIWLFLEAYKDDPVPVILFENVPRIATRGRHLLDQIVGLLRGYGYAVQETGHDCGEIADPPLAQSRERFLLIARHLEKVPPFIYEPVKRPLRAVGEILSKFPLPGDPIAGPMHRMPALQWKTWVRLAFVEAGKDWRSLERLRVADGVLQDYLLVPEMRNGTLGVNRWGDSTGTIQGESLPLNGKFSVADPGKQDPHGGKYRVTEMNESAGAVIAASATGNGAYAVADPGIDGHEKSVQFGLRRWTDTAGVVTAKMFVGGGPNAVQDPRIGDHGKRYNNVYRVVRWTETHPAVTGGAGPTAGGTAVADPRTGYGENSHENKYRVVGFDNAAGAVIGTNKGPGSGAQSVADPLPNKPAAELHGKFHVTPFTGHSRAVIAGRENGGGYVADPGIRLNKDGSGPYGVVPWSENAQAVLGSGRHDNSYSNVADPRLPDATERLVALIIAPDNTWHRPFTTLELAGLQSLIDPEEYWPTDAKVASEIKKFEDSLWMPKGKYSDTEWREHIGNAVPRKSARGMGSVIYRALLGARLGETFTLSSMPVWVRPIAVALSVNVPGGI